MGIRMGDYDMAFTHSIRDSNVNKYYRIANEQPPKQKRDLNVLKDYDVDVKMKSPDILESRIVPPITKIQVVNGPIHDNTFLPETLGFVSYTRGSGNGANITDYQTVILRRGKNGQPRLDFNTLRSPIFYISKSIIELFHTNDVKYSVLMETLPLEPVVTQMSDADFLGWITAKAHFLNYLSSNFTGGKSNWPQGSNHILNQMVHLPQNFNNDPDHMREVYRSEGKRTQCITAIREMEAKMMQCIASYNISVVQREQHSLKSIEQKAEQYEHATISRKCFEATYESLCKKEDLWQKRKDDKSKNNEVSMEEDMVVDEAVPNLDPHNYGNFSVSFGDEVVLAAPSDSDNMTVKWGESALEYATPEMGHPGQDVENGITFKKLHEEALQYENDVAVPPSYENDIVNGNVPEQVEPEPEIATNTTPPAPSSWPTEYPTTAPTAATPLSVSSEKVSAAVQSVIKDLTEEPSMLKSLFGATLDIEERKRSKAHSRLELKLEKAAKKMKEKSKKRKKRR